MTKTTKWIAIGGGGLVVLLFILSLIFPNSALGGWMDLVGCSRKAKKAPPRFCDKPENKNTKWCKRQARKARPAAKQEQARPAARPTAAPAARPAAPATGNQGKAAGQGGAGKAQDDDD